MTQNTRAVPAGAPRTPLCACAAPEPGGQFEFCSPRRVSRSQASAETKVWVARDSARSGPFAHGLAQGWRLVLGIRPSEAGGRPSLGGMRGVGSRQEGRRSRAWRSSARWGGWSGCFRRSHLLSACSVTGCFPSLPSTSLLTPNRKGPSPPQHRGDAYLHLFLFMYCVFP